MLPAVRGLLVRRASWLLVYAPLTNNTEQCKSVHGWLLSVPLPVAKWHCPEESGVGCGDGASAKRCRAGQLANQSRCPLGRCHPCNPARKILDSNSRRPARSGHLGTVCPRENTLSTPGTSP
eukprot:3211249-Rhodomonas_salina.2